jgi:hypothetical protein
MRDEESTKAERMDMAKSAAPYLHAKLSTIEATVDATVEGTLTEIRRTIVDPRN